MARNEARIFSRIWVDPDWRSLTAGAQHCYLMLLSLPSLSFCGVIAYTPKRWSQNAKNLTIKAISAGISELRAKRYVVVDEETEELWIRSFAKNDGVTTIPNLVVSMARDWEQVMSDPIRHEFVKELPEGFAQGLPQGLRQRLPPPFLEALGEGSPEPLAQGMGYSSLLSPSPLSSPPAPSGTVSETPGRPGGPKAEMERRKIDQLCASRAAIPRILEHPLERAQARQLAERAWDVLAAANGKPPPAGEVVDWTWWGLTHCDAKLVDETIGACAELEQPARTVAYLAKTLRSRAAQRGVEMPEWRPPRGAER